MRTGTQIIKVTLKPGVAVTKNVDGSFFMLLSCSAPITISPNGKYAIPCQPGRGMTVDNFSTLTVANLNAAALPSGYPDAVAIIMVSSDQVFSGMTFSQQAATTSFSQVAAVTNLATTSIIGLKTAGGFDFRRKAITIQNQDASKAVQIYSNGSSAGLLLAPAGILTLETDDDILLLCAAAGTSNVGIFETYYLIL